MGRFTGLLGILFILGMCYAFSTNRKAIRLKTIAWGLGLQFFFALLVMKYSVGQAFMKGAGDAATKLFSYATVGATFVWGPLGNNGPITTLDGASAPFKVGFIFATQILPIIIFIAAFFAVMYYLGIMQFIIKIAAKFMTIVMGCSGAESLDVAASIFMGQTEAPLTIRPFLPKLTRSELMVVMTAGMAHISGSIMAAYAAYGAKTSNLLSAVVMTAPGTILMAKMLVPETEVPVSGSNVEIADVEEFKDSNVLGAIARGTLDGLHLALNVGAMLVSFVALIALVDGIFGWVHFHALWFPTSLEQLFGWVFAPIAWLIGVPWKDCIHIGNLLGTRMVINELVAFSQLGPMAGTIDPRSFTIATFALCGFANFSSIGIQLGGIGALAPNKKEELAKLGFRAMLAGTAANLISAAIVGMLV
jgi:concentrative nucleoside transporter, CNT family